MAARIAEFRMGSSITQVQLADIMGVSQQTVTSWEVGRRGVPVSVLPVFARTLGVSVEVLIGGDPSPAAAKRGPTAELQQQMGRIRQLPKTKQRFVMDVLETVLAQSRR